MLTVITEPTGELPKAWRYWPFSTEYREDTPLRITKGVDIHSFGMTMIEVKSVHLESMIRSSRYIAKVYTRQMPFPNLPDTMNTITKLVRGGLPVPPKPRNMPDEVWSVVQQCITRGGQLDAASLEQRLADPRR